MAQENRKHKDSVFVDLFYSDITADQNILSLYNALHDDNLTDTSVVNKLKVEDVLYKDFQNDISFEIKGKVLVFGEHQSTVNKNMPLRCLMYAGRAYEQIIDKKVRYKRNLVKISPPEFYVFYNGAEDAPKEETLKLSDAYNCKASSNSLELVVKVININSNKKHEILEKCKVLGEYTFFMETVKKRKGQEDAIKEAIRECISKGVLVDYLQRKGSEVNNMLTAEYNFEEALEVAREEEREEGRKEGREAGKIEMLKQFINKFLDMGMTSFDISTSYNIPESQVLEVEKERINNNL